MPGPPVSYAEHLMHTKRLICCFLPFLLLLLAGAEDASRRAADQKALAGLQLFVGQWKGVGQVRRGSRAGAWIEKNTWAWHFENGRAWLAFTATDGKFFKQGELKAVQNGLFELIAHTPDNLVVKYRGRISEEKLVLHAVTSDKTPLGAGVPARVTLRTVADGDRLVTLYESKSNATYRRMAETGFTRQGSQFGKAAGYAECVVTGGKASMEVTHNKKTYYVCCSGCRDLFNEDPVAVLAEYRAKQKK